MTTLLHAENGASVTQLVGGIVGDAQDLLKQQMALFRHEVQEDLRKTRNVAITLACGFFLAQTGVILLCLMLVYLLAHLEPTLPLWGCFGIVGGVLAAAGVACLFGGYLFMKSFNPLPDESARALKENYKWITSAK